MRSVALLLIACLLSSCATITHGSDEIISVESSPSGASATIRCAGNISASGTTPARLKIPRKADGCNVNIEKSGLKTRNIEMERGFSGEYWFNLAPTVGLPIGAFANAVGWILFGLSGAAGLIVDRVTGAMYDHNPHVINVTLQPEQ
jgi:hypothetical protein